MRTQSLVRLGLAAAALAALAFAAARPALPRAVAADCGSASMRVDAVPGGAVDTTANVSGTFTVNIVITGSGNCIGAFNFTLSYDRSVLSAAVPTTAGLPSSALDCTLPDPSAALPEDNTSADGDPATGDAFLSCFGRDGATAPDGPVASITFTVVGSGHSLLKLHTAEAAGPSGEQLLSCSSDVSSNYGGGCFGATVSTDGSPVPPPPPSGDSCVVAAALDGETVLCADGSRVRLIGVASPLGADPGADWAKALTQWFMGGKTLTLEKDTKQVDEFGSVLAYPHVTGTDGNDYNMSVLLIYIGMAHHGPDGVNTRYDSWLSASQSWARTACWNMWAAGNPFAAESGCS